MKAHRRLENHMGTLIGAILALVIGILLIVWTAELLLHILGWVLIVAAAIWIVRYLLGSHNRSNL